jgi:hypothetical protein
LLKARDEAQRPAVYIMLGSSSGAESAAFESAVYVGACDSLIERFANGHHKMQAAEWSQIFLATTLEDTFNKAHATRAEHLLVTAAKEAKRADPLNGGTAPGKLAPGDAAFAAEFVENVRVLAQTLGVSVFRSSATLAMKAGVEASGKVTPAPSEFEFVYTKTGPTARMLIDGLHFTILAGSLARAEDMKGLPPGSRLKREAARKAGILVPTDTRGVERFVHDFVTSSASAAGEVVYGSSCAGTTAWRHIETGLLYRDWQAKQAGSRNE